MTFEHPAPTFVHVNENKHWLDFIIYNIHNYYSDTLNSNLTINYLPIANHTTTRAKFVMEYDRIMKSTICGIKIIILKFL